MHDLVCNVLLAYAFMYAQLSNYKPTPLHDYAKLRCCALALFLYRYVDSLLSNRTNQAGAFLSGQEVLLYSSEYCIPIVK